MPKNIVIQSNCYNSQTLSFNYKFPVAQSFKSKQIALTNIAIYNQFFNISTAYGNNTIVFTFNSLVPQTFTWVIPDGYYDISSLNYCLQSFMVTNKLYVTSTAGLNVYFYQVITNSSRYAVEQDFAYIPTSAQASTAGYTQVAACGWNYPSSSQTCQISFNSAFGSLIGFTTYTTYPTSISSASVQLISNVAPELSVVNCLVLTCNLIRSGGLSYPDNIFTIIPLNVAFGSLITLQSGMLCYTDIADNNYNEISIQIMDQNLNILKLIDLDCNISVSIKDKSE